MSKLEIKNLHVSVEGKEILKGLTLTLRNGEVHALMGPNGSGKSTLSYFLLGHPKYKMEKGSVKLDGKNILKLTTDERAKAGLFLAFQHPVEIEGVGCEQLLQLSMQAYAQARGEMVPSPAEFHALAEKARKEVGLEEKFLHRSVNAGFSGGERKRAEVLQLLLARPSMAILDETDSGLDIDSLKSVARAVGSLRGPRFGALVITHYPRLLHYLKPSRVHVLLDGRIVRSGGPELVRQLEQKGYGWLGQRRV